MRHFCLSLLYCVALSAPLACANTAPPSNNGQHNRIIALAPHLVESLFAMGAGAQIIATTEHADFPAEAANIPRVGNYARLQIERIVQLDPDVVIAWKTGNPVDDLERLERYNINVVYAGATQLSEVADELRLLGKLTGRETIAESLAQNYSKRLSKLKQLYASAAPVTGFYEMWPRPLRTVANNAWLQQQLTVCGVENPFKNALEDYPLVSLEKVLALNPQIVIQPTTHSNTAPDALKWQQWPNISAVEHGFILTPNADKSHRSTARMLDELELLCAQVDTARQFYSSSH